VAGLLVVFSGAFAEVKSQGATGFVLEREVVVPGRPEQVFDLFTGDVTAWWDHHMSEAPRAMFIEPKPGGGFYEIFDEEGNGVLHATVTYAERGKMLRFHGPLGLAGYAIDMVHTVRFQEVGAGGTRVELVLRAMGEVEEGWPQVVDRVWDHFLSERFLPFAESQLGEEPATEVVPGERRGENTATDGDTPGELEEKRQ
jgi:hypothetical protein